MEITTESLISAAHELKSVVLQGRERAAAVLEEVQRNERELRLVLELLKLRGVEFEDGAQETRPTASTSGQSGITESPRLGDAVVEILRTAGQPLHIRDLVSRIQERGLAIPGRGEPANLIVHIRTHPDIVRPVRGMYALREWGVANHQIASLGPARMKRRRRRTTGRQRKG